MSMSLRDRAEDFLRWREHYRRVGRGGKTQSSWEHGAYTGRLSVVPVDRLIGSKNYRAHAALFDFLWEDA